MTKRMVGGTCFFLAFFWRELDLARNGKKGGKKGQEAGSAGVRAGIRGACAATGCMQTYRVGYDVLIAIIPVNAADVLHAASAAVKEVEQASMTAPLTDKTCSM